MNETREEQTERLYVMLDHWMNLLYEVRNVDLTKLDRRRKKKKKKGVDDDEAPS